MTLDEFLYAADIENVEKMGWEIYCAEMRLGLTESEDILKLIKKKIVKDDHQEIDSAYNLAYRKYWGIFS